MIESGRDSVHFKSPFQTARLLSSAASVNATFVAIFPVRVLHIQGYNASESVRYLKLYSKASAPSESDTPVKTIALPPVTAFALDWTNVGFLFPLGLGYRLTTGSADNDTGALTSGDVLGLNIDYVRG